MQPRGFAFQRQHAGRLGQTLFQKRALIGKLLFDQVELLTESGNLRIHAFDLRSDLGGALLQLFRLFQNGFSARGEQAALTFDQVGHFGAGFCQFGQFARKLRRGGVVAFGLKPGAAGHDFEELAFDDGEFGFHQGPIQPDQKIARLHRLRLFHRDFGYHPAIGVLHHLAVLRHLDLARGDHRPSDFGRNRPNAKAQHQNGGGHAADNHRCAGREKGLHFRRGARFGRGKVSLGGL